MALRLPVLEELALATPAGLALAPGRSPSQGCADGFMKPPSPGGLPGQPRMLQGCLSEPSLTSYSWTSSDVGRKLRPGSGRFRSDEMACMRKLPTPSAGFEQKAEVYVQSTMAQKRVQSESGLHTLPTMKGEFYRFRADHFHPPAPDAASLARPELEGQRVEELPMERPIAAVLNKIFPFEAPQERDEKGSRKPPVVKRGGSLRPGGASPSKLEKPKRSAYSGDAQRSLLLFRQKLLDKFATVQSAFALLAADVPGGSEREMSRKDFAKFLDKHFPGLSRDDHIRIFDFLDTNKNGGISVTEFRAAIEAASPVRSLEDLRRKLIALGYLSMRQVLREMDAATGSKKMLSYAEFALALTKVGITQDSEHQAIFQALLDPYAVSTTVTLDQLSSALAAVSPILLLEDVRYRIVSKFGTAQAAFAALDTDASNTLSQPEFVRSAIHIWRMSHYEATKAFDLIDADRSREISRREFVCAMGLSEPSLFLEDIRRKVRQRFRSIAEALLKGETGAAVPQVDRRADLDSQASIADEDRPSSGEEPSLKRSGASNWRGKTVSSAMHSDISASDVWNAFNDVAVQEEALTRQTPAMLRETLSKVHLKDSETTALFTLVDIDGNGEVTPLEFSKGIRFFAPACILDDLRLRCLVSNSRVADAFSAIPAERRNEVLNAKGVREVLADMHLAEGINVDAIVDLLEPHRVGGVTISELIAALQEGAPGSHVPLSPDMIDARARQQVKAQMSPFLNSARDLRSDVRRKPSEEAKKPEFRTFSSSRLPPMEPVAEGHESNEREFALKRGKGPTCSHLPMPGFVQQSYNKVSRTCRQVLKPQESEPIVKRLRGYYTAAGSTVADHDDLLSSTAPSRLGNFCALSQHRSVISRPATLRGNDSVDQLF